MIKVMSIFGTRPEAIKMAPLVKKLEAEDGIDSVLCVTAQHREMLDQVLELFSLTPQHDLDLMKRGQTLEEITTRVLLSVGDILNAEKPDLVLVHGDTTTTFSAALAAFYKQIPVGHVEAGLRTGDRYSPFPEEMNRLLTSRLATLHFAATDGNVANLLSENVPSTFIYKTGNTVIDALLSVVREDYIFDNPLLNQLDFKNKRILSMTAHRRENLGAPMAQIFTAVRRIADDFEDVEIVFPVHLNPVVREAAAKYLGNHSRIHLIEPLEYEPFANLLGKSYFILSDSGGIQEEAPALGKPVVVLRTETERPEAVEAGTVVVAGVEAQNIYNICRELLTDADHYKKMAEAVNPYGDGKSCERIVEAIKNWYKTEDK
jgi:UDP-N-acetylglucosamine 2-epimerase (non-hydrolysing)